MLLCIICVGIVIRILLHMYMGLRNVILILVLLRRILVLLRTILVGMNTLVLLILILILMVICWW